LLALGEAVQNAKKILDEEFSPDGYNIGVNNGVSSILKKILTKKAR
jgi:diadenosine tetraphosphate (Ap4A) HIT family hydrolase